MSALPQVSTLAPAPQEDNITEYPPRADDQDVSREVIIHYQPGWLFPCYISDALAMLDHYPDGEPISQAHRTNQAPRGILKAPKLPEDAPQTPVARHPQASGPWLPKYYNPRKRQREVESDETEDDREPRRHGRFPTPLRPFKRPRFSSYSLVASRIDIPRSSWICGVDPVAGTKRPRDAMSDMFDREDVDEKRPAPGLYFSGSQVLYGFICANSVDDTAPVAQFLPIPQFHLAPPPYSITQPGLDETEINLFIETDPVDDLSNESAAETDTRSVRFTRKAVDYLADRSPSGEERESVPRAKKPALQAAHDNEKWMSWFKWMVRRQTAPCRHQHRRDLEILEERLCAAKTPHAVEIAEQGLSVFKARWKVAVKKPQVAIAEGETWKKIKDLWPHLYPISASDLLQEVVTAMDTLSENPEEPSLLVEPATPQEDSFTAEAGPSSHPTSLISTLPPQPVPFAEEHNQAFFHQNSPHVGSAFALEAGQASGSTLPAPNAPSSSPAPRVEAYSLAAPCLDSPHAMTGSSSQFTAAAPTMLLPSENLQEVPVEAPPEVQVITRRPPMSLRSGLQVEYRPKPRKPRPVQTNPTKRAQPTGPTRRPRGKAKR